MAEMSKDEAQALVNKSAPLMRLAHNAINEQAEVGNPLAIMLKPLVDALHSAAVPLVLYADLELPAEGLGGVSTRSGGK